MSEKITNALAEMKQVYLAQVGHNNLEKQRLDEETKQIKRWWKESSESDQIETHMNDLVSDETEKSNEAALNVLKVLKTISSLKPQPQVKESTHYSWRDTVDESILWEIIDDTEQKQVKEKKVNNYSGKEPVITVNPEFNTESVIIDTVELNEDFIQESIDIVTDYLCEEGLTYEDIENLIEEVGVEEFYEWLVEFGYETLCEQQAFQGELLTSKGQARKNPKISKSPGASTPVRHTPSTSEPEKESSATSSPGQLSLNLTPKAVRRTRVQGKVVPGSRSTKKSISSVNPKQSIPKEPEKKNPSTPNKALVRDLIGSVAELAKRERAAKEATKKGGIAAGLRSFFLKPEYHEQFETWVDNLLDEGYDLSEYTWDELYEEYEDLYEKAVSEQQQKIFGLALSVKRGETSRSKVSDEVLKIVDSMSEKEIRKYAKTSHEGIPKTVDESYLVEKVINFVRENR